MEQQDSRGGRPTTVDELQRDLQESALFEVGEGIAFIEDYFAHHRRLEEILKAQAASTERARVALQEELKEEARLRIFAENEKRLASVRLRELHVEQHHLVAIAAKLGIDKIRIPELEVAR